MVPRITHIDLRDHGYPEGIIYISRFREGINHISKGSLIQREIIHRSKGSFMDPRDHSYNETLMHGSLIKIGSMNDPSLY